MSQPLLVLLLSYILSVNACDIMLKQWLKISFLCPHNYYNNNKFKKSLLDSCESCILIMRFENDFMYLVNIVVHTVRCSLFENFIQIICLVIKCNIKTYRLQVITFCFWSSGSNNSQTLMMKEIFINYLLSKGGSLRLTEVYVGLVIFLIFFQWNIATFTNKL